MNNIVIASYELPDFYLLIPSRSQKCNRLESGSTDSSPGILKGLHQVRTPIGMKEGLRLNKNNIEKPIDEGGDFLVWVPSGIMAVIGRGNRAEKSLFMDKIIEDQIPVIQRPTGGEAVMLSPQMVAVSVAEWGDNQEWASSSYFRRFNNIIIEAINDIGVKGLNYKGISDITLNNKKIAGSSLYRNKRMVFFHCIMNISQSPDIMERYLRFPAKTPDYRQNRNHRDFVTSLHNQGYFLPIERVRESIENKFRSYNNIKYLQV